jgi:DNA topoisomerase-1
MTYNLFIVESPAKCPKIEQYLGAGNKCIASYGHFRELNGLQSINIHNNFATTFIISESKQSQVNKIRKAVKDAKEVFLATDDDREGEAIAWHLCVHFGLPINTTKRIVFHEVTESALKNAVQNYGYLNMALVEAQLTRQIIDMLVGYKLSPILWKNVKEGTSAGRCQTPALRLIYDNYKAIEASPGSKEYNTTGYFTSQNIPFVLNHNFPDIVMDTVVNSDTSVDAFIKASLSYEHLYKCGELRDSKKPPPQPFTTSRLQQVASTNLHTTPKETMKICQKLYEEGHITYMRTDSTFYSPEFIQSALSYIQGEWGAEYAGPGLQPNIKEKMRDKKNDKSKLAQEAHEAIRPTQTAVKALDEKLFTQKECKMYKLIWSNALESLMTPALYKGLTATITAPFGHMYKFSTEQVLFPGWRIVNGCEAISKEFVYLQTLKLDSIVKFKKITAKVSMKEMKSHYTEAKLVQLLEEEGIGRPSTYASLIEKIQERGYVKKENVKGICIHCLDYEVTAGGNIVQVRSEREFGNEKNKLVIKPLGIMVLEYLLVHFQPLFEYTYTKTMEEQLDNIAHGRKVWSELCKECATDLDGEIRKIADTNKGKEHIRIDNEHSYMMGKYGPVLKCTDAEKNVTFKPVNPDLDLEKLRTGAYALADVVLAVGSDDKKGRSLGVYGEKEVVLRSGKFGWYLEWGTEKKALKITLAEATALTMDDVIETLYDLENGEGGVIRVINKETSIRKGKGNLADYIFHKNKKMKKPKFLKLTGFKENYRTCDINILHAWLKKTYDINQPTPS